MPHQYNKLDSNKILKSILSMMISARSFQLHDCRLMLMLMITNMFGFCFIIRGWCSGDCFHCSIVFNDGLVIAHGISMECTLTHAKLFENAHTATVQVVNQHVDDEYTKYTPQTNNYRLSRFSPVEQPINCF